MPDLFIAKKKSKSQELPQAKPQTTTPQEHKLHANPSGQTKNLHISHAPSPPSRAATTKTHQQATLLSTYCPFPTNVSFENQEEGEVIYLFLKRHFLTNLRWLITALLCCLIPLTLIFFLPFLATLNIPIPGSYTLVLVLFYYLIIFGYMYINFISWFYNIGIITNLRVVDVDVTDISHKNVAATSIADIVDVEYSQKGFLQGLFDYGSVHIQTEGLKPNFEFVNVPHPAKTSDVISDLLREVKE